MRRPKSVRAGAERAAPSKGGQQAEPEPLALRATPEGTLLPVRLIPRATRTELAGVRDGALLVRLTAPPVEGAANAALLAYLADRLALPKSALALVSGAAARQKTLLIQGRAPSEVRTRLGI